jgi:glycosyltransferase involved in cell wall biosynthesis
VPERALTPIVSVVVPVYNGERFLAATIDSVLAQAFTEFELIIVDDGSTDGSAEIVKLYRDTRLRFVRQANRGPAMAVDAGIREARAGYIAFLDQDDLWETGKLKAHIELLNQRPEIDLTFSWFRIVDEAGRDVGLRSQRARGTFGFRSLLTDFVVGATSNVVVRREAIERAGGIDSSFRRLYDLDLFLRIAWLAPQNVAAIPADLVRYRRHPAQITRDVRALRQEWEAVLEKLRRLAPEDVAAVAHYARSNMSRYFARIAYEAAHYRTALGFLKDSSRLAPAAFLADRRNWLTAAACLSGLLLPGRWHRALERLAGFRSGEP